MKNNKLKYSAFVPDNLHVLAVLADDDKGLKEVKFIVIKGIWPDGSVGIDQYYHSGFASFKRIRIEELEKIKGYENGVQQDDVIALYKKAFNIN